MTILRFTVPGAPVPCARARVFKDSRTGKTRSANPPKTTAYKKAVRTHAVLAANLARWPLSPRAEYEIQIEVHRAERRGDLDNYWKGIADALTGVAWLDDRQVTSASIWMDVDRANPRVDVVVMQLPLNEKAES